MKNQLALSSRRETNMLNDFVILFLMIGKLIDYKDVIK